MLTKIVSLIIQPLYPKSEGANPYNIIGSVLFTQKILGFNRLIPWPAHFTSRIINPKNIKLGTRSFPGWSQGCYIQAKNGILIGDNLRMGPNVGLISANHSLDDYDRWEASKPITIGNNVWIGMNSIVMPGITIGDNVVIGANSTVTKDIPPNTICAGNPCKVLSQKPAYKGRVYSSS